MTSITLTDTELGTTIEILSFLDRFLRTASPTVHAELTSFGDAHGQPFLTAWLLDATGLMAQQLHTILSRAQHPPAAQPTPPTPAGQR